MGRLLGFKDSIRFDFLLSDLRCVLTCDGACYLETPPPTWCYLPCVVVVLWSRDLSAVDCGLSPPVLGDNMTRLTSMEFSDRRVSFVDGRGEA